MTRTQTHHRRLNYLYATRVKGWSFVADWGQNGVVYSNGKCRFVGPDFIAQRGVGHVEKALAYYEAMLTDQQGATVG